jgi:hypothetical protein
VKRRFPVLCPSGEGLFPSLEDGAKFYAEQGFAPFDSSNDWQLLRDEDWRFEALVRRDGGQWRGTVAQIAA